jgi:DNA adenine methylase
MTQSITKKPPKHYSPLRYPGGKAILSSLIEKLIRALSVKEVVYVEPYAGGAGAALTLLFQEAVDSIVLNDFDYAIYSFWKAVTHNNKDFIDKIKGIDLTVEEWELQKSIFHNPASSNFDLGFSTFFLNRTNRSGILNSGPIGGKDQSGNWKIDARFNRTELIKRVEKIGKYKNRIKVQNEDGIDLTRSMIPNKSYFIYLDPPYVCKGSDLYLNYYKEDDHENLAELLNHNASSQWLLSYDNVELIRNLYMERRQVEFDLVYHADKVKYGKELLILSDLLN